MNSPVSCHAREVQRVPRAIALGAFDGVHIGHQAVVGAMIKAAHRLRITSAALTFEPTPRQFFTADRNGGKRLTPNLERVQLLCNLGVDQVLVQTFDDDFHRMSPEEFAQSILVEQLDTRYVAVGASHTFGAGRGAGPERMRQLGVGLGFEVEIVPLISVGGLFVSSTSIRNALAKGDLATARTMLGRPYMVSGTVVRGMGVGADLGAPTANLAVPTDKLLPADGVYAAQAALGDKNTVLPAAIVIGPSPTLAIAETRVEVHLLDFEGDLYGAELTVALWERLRPIVAFGSREELSRQIAADLKRVREMCEKSPE